jgi:urease gamma subunit
VPRATVNLDDTEEIKLKSLPDGIVTLRRMSYGQKLTRQEQAVKMSMEQEKGKRSGKMNMDMLQHAATVFDFRACIVSHNLEDAAGQLLNLTQVQVIDSLDPRVGEEIAENINRMNNFEEDLEDSGFPNGSELL